MAKKAATESKAKATKPTDTKKPATKNEILSTIAESAGLTKKQVSDVLDKLTEMIVADLGKKGPGSFTIPNVLKLRRVEKKATKARKGRNPATGEEITIPAKPKSTDVRARILKTLKESVK